MSVSEIMAWVQAGQVLVAAGQATAANIKTWMNARHPNASEADLNAICDGSIAGAYPPPNGTGQRSGLPYDLPRNEREAPR